MWARRPALDILDMFGSRDTPRSGSADSRQSTRIAFRHAETDRVCTREFVDPAGGVDLHGLCADLHKEFSHGPRDQTLLQFNFEKPHISGYRGVVECDTLPKWEAALKEWNAGALDRHRMHLRDLVVAAELELSETHLKPDHAGDRNIRDKSLTETLETVRSLCMERYAVVYMLKDTCSLPETMADITLDARDNVLEALLCTLWTFLHKGGSEAAKRLVEAGLTRFLVKRLKLFMKAHSEHSGNEFAKVVVPRFIGCLTALAQIPESSSYLSSKRTVTTFLGMMSFCHSRGLSDQLAPLIALLAPVVNPSTIPTVIDPDDMHVISNVAGNSPKLAIRCSALHVYVAWFNAKKSHTVEEVDENLHLLVSEIKWALHNLDLPAKVFRYLSSKPESRSFVLSQNPDLLEQMAILQKQEPDLYVLIRDAADIQLKHHPKQLSMSGCSAEEDAEGQKKTTVTESWIEP